MARLSEVALSTKGASLKVSDTPFDLDRQRNQLGTAIILLMALFAMGTLSAYRGLLQHNGEIDVAVLNKKRFDGLRAALPPRGTIGYLSDTNTNEGYYLAQYFLAPLVIAPDAQRKLVVANFASGTAISRMAAARGLVVVRDFGNGVALLQRVR